MVQVQATVQKIQGIFEQCLAVHDKLEASLRDLSRTGDIQSCKAARKAADAQFKELSKVLKPLLTSLQSSPQSYQIWPKVSYYYKQNIISCQEFEETKSRNYFSYCVSCHVSSNLNLNFL